MSLWSDLRDGIRKIILMEVHLERLTASTTKLADAIEDHEKRLIRIETMIEMADRRREDNRQISDQRD